jgi:hypothetical protein
MTQEEYSEYIARSAESLRKQYANVLPPRQVPFCKDCRFSFRLTDQDGNKLLLCTEMGRRGLKEDDFCSYGERMK